MENVNDRKSLQYSSSILRIPVDFNDVVVYSYLQVLGIPTTIDIITTLTFTPSSALLQDPFSLWHFLLEMVLMNNNITGFFLIVNVSVEM